MFTQREFLHLDDLLHHEELEVKKFIDRAQHCSDPQLQQLLTSLAQRHEQHFNQLLQTVNQQAQNRQQLQSQSTYQQVGYQQPSSYQHVGQFQHQPSYQPSFVSSQQPGS